MCIRDSTLTMQVARIIDPALREGRSRSIGGKLRQVLRALQLEAHLSKRQILTLYLERAPFGGPIEGVEAASWAYPVSYTHLDVYKRQVLRGGSAASKITPARAVGEVLSLIHI